MKKSQQGVVLAIVLITLSVMLVMVYVLSQIVTSQQKSTTNYADIKLAENYARMAMFKAEESAFYFDLNNSMESPNISCDLAANQVGGSKARYVDADCLGIRRGWQLKHLKVGTNKDLIDNGEGSCHDGDSTYQGFCYKSISIADNNAAEHTFNSDQSWTPWTVNLGSTVKPCDSYMVPRSSANSIPSIDDKDSHYSIMYSANNVSLCTNPRYIIEPININYRGNYSLIGDDPKCESDIFTQINGAKITVYKADAGKNVSYDNSMGSTTVESGVIIPSGRLYRLTVVAFGRNGNTRVVLQEIIMINNFSTNELRLPMDTFTNKSYRIVRISTRWLKD